MDTHELLVRYFKCRIIGSFLFVQEGLLSSDTVNDIDINVVDHQISKVRTFLSDHGYIETKPAYQQRGYADFEGSKVFTKQGHLNIHLLPTNDLLNVYSLGELIAKKYDRGLIDDLKQLELVITSKLQKLCTKK